jgi:hypothetical protein
VLTRSAADATDFPFAIESLDESARRYFELENTTNHPYDALLAFRLGEVFALRDEADLALGKFEEALELLEKDPQFLSGRPMRSYIPRRLGYAYWEMAEAIRGGGGNSDFMLTRRRDAYSRAIRVTKQAYELANATLQASPERADMLREAQLSANNLLYYSIEFVRAKGSEEALDSLGLDRSKRAVLLKFIAPTEDDVDRQENPSVVDTIREAARLSGDRKLETRAARRVLLLLESEDWRNRYPPEEVESMRFEARKALET